ncbi:MAG: zinc ribbon domain-containing protein [Planctomycetia bacterium]|nr:zinc ribbon domain-containing protein [Planctomycetia bacterium]
MPLYRYQHVHEKGEDCPEVFEVLQSRSEAALSVCPKCGHPCEKRFDFRVASLKSERDTLSPKNLAKHGFTQYKKSGDGFYEKTCGDGPQVISADEARKLQNR